MVWLRWLAAGVLTVAAAAPIARSDAEIPELFNQGAAPIDIGVAIERGGLADAATCAECHADIAAEWESSWHSSAWTNDVFQAAYQDEPREACRNCHAPLRRTEMPTGIAAEQGVSCATCHVRGDEILGTGRTDSGPHEVRVVASMNDSGYCAGCHQFDFPNELATDRGLAATHEPMQDTYEEWLSSHFADDGVQCQNCHMPWVAGSDGRRHRSHAFPGGHDPDLLSSAVDVSVQTRRSDEHVIVEVTIEPTHVGHSFPTGDLFRRVELRVAGDERPAQVAGFAREFTDHPQRLPNGELTFVRRQSADSRIPPPGFGRPEVHRFELPADTRIVAWSLDHLLMPTPLAATYGFSSARSRVVVAAGEIVIEEGENE